MFDNVNADGSDKWYMITAERNLRVSRRMKFAALLKHL